MIYVCLTAHVTYEGVPLLIIVMYVVEGKRFPVWNGSLRWRVKVQSQTCNSGGLEF